MLLPIAVIYFGKFVILITQTHSDQNKSEEKVMISQQLIFLMELRI